MALFHDRAEDLVGVGVGARARVRVRVRVRARVKARVGVGARLRIWVRVRVRVGVPWRRRGPPVAPAASPYLLTLTMATLTVAIYLRLLPQQSELRGGGLPHAEAVDELLVSMAMVSIAIVSIAIVSIAKAC